MLLALIWKSRISMLNYNFKIMAQIRIVIINQAINDREYDYHTLNLLMLLVFA